MTLIPRRSKATTAPGPVTAVGGKIVQAGEVRSSRIESLRAIAALGVFMTHSVTIATGNTRGWAHGTWLSFPHWGPFGVMMFFSLTGYLLFWPFAKRAFGTRERVNYKRYALNRVVRILPLYYVSMLIMILAFGRGDGSLRMWVFTMLLIPTFDQAAAGINSPMWSVACEIQFYAFLPIFTILLATISRRRLLPAALTVVALGVGSYYLQMHVFDVGGGMYRSIVGRWYFFVPGLLVALLRLKWRELPSWVRGPVARSDLWLLAGLGLFVFAMTYVQEHQVWEIRPDVAVVGAFFLIVAGSVLPLRAGVAARILEWRPIAWLGVISYSFYVWHRFILLEIDDNRVWPTPDFYFLMLGIVLAVAFVSYNLIEKPFLKLRGKWADSAPSHIGEVRTQLEGEAPEPAPALEPALDSGRAATIAAHARRFALLARRPEALGEMASEAPDLDRLCGNAVASLSRGGRAGSTLLDTLGVLDADRICGIYFALPPERRKAVRRHPAWGPHIDEVEREIPAADERLRELIDSPATGQAVGFAGA